MGFLGRAARVGVGEKVRKVRRTTKKVKVKVVEGRRNVVEHEEEGEEGQGSRDDGGGDEVIVTSHFRYVSGPEMLVLVLVLGMMAVVMVVVHDKHGVEL